MKECAGRGIELGAAYMPSGLASDQATAPGTCKFDEDPISIEWVDRTRSNMGFLAEMNSLIWLEFELIQDFMVVLVTCKIDENPIKSEAALSFHPICPQTLCSLFPTPMMLQIKFVKTLATWPQRY